MAEGPRKGQVGQEKSMEGLIFQIGSEGQDLNRTSWKGLGGRKTDKAGFMGEGSENSVIESGWGMDLRQRASCMRYFICRTKWWELAYTTGEWRLRVREATTFPSTGALS